MTFTVTYRGADGAVHEERVEATSRGECFAQMKARGIAPMSVKEGNFVSRRGAEAQRGEDGGSLRRGASDRRGQNGKGQQARKRTVVCVLAVVFVALLVGGLWWWMQDGRGVTRPAESEPPKKSALAKEVKPAAAPEPEPEKAMPAPAKKKWRSLHGIPESETNSLDASQLKLWRRMHPTGPIRTNSVKALSFEDRVFGAGTVNSQIAYLLTAEPGTALVGSSSDLYNANFLKHFKKSLEQDIEDTPDDTAEVLQLKAAVRETRSELKSIMESGGDICKVLADAREEVRNLGVYRAELETELKRLSADGSMSDQDIEDYISAANQMLRERGAKEISGKNLIKRRIHLREVKARESAK